MNNPRSRSIFARSILGPAVPKRGECARTGVCQYMDKELHLMGDCFSKYCDRYPVKEQAAAPLTREQRADYARRVMEAQQARYEEEGEELGDFADGERFLRDDVSDAELLGLLEMWVGKDQR